MKETGGVVKSALDVPHVGRCAVGFGAFVAPSEEQATLNMSAGAVRSRAWRTRQFRTSAAFRQSTGTVFGRMTKYVY